MKRICFLSLTPLRSLALLFLLLVLAPSRTSTRSPPSASPLSALTIRHRVFPSNVTTLPPPPPPPPDLQINSLSLSPLCSSLSDTFPLSLALVFASRRTSRHICSTLKKWLTIEIPRSWCVLAHSGYWWKVKFFRSVSSSGYHWKDGATGIFIGRQSVRLIKHCKFKCRESIGRINLKLCEYFSPLLAIEQFLGTDLKRSSDLVVSEILRSRYPSMYSSSKISWYVTGTSQFRYAAVEIHESSSSRHSS